MIDNQTGEVQTLHIRFFAESEAFVSDFTFAAYTQALGKSSMPFCIIHVSTNHIVYHNEAYGQIFGIVHAMHERDASCINSILRKVDETGKSQRFSLYDEGVGRRFSILCETVSSGFCGLFFNDPVNDDKQDSLSSVISSVPGGIFQYCADPGDDHFVFVSENMLRMLGYTEQEFKEKFHDSFAEMVYVEDRKRVLDEINTQISKDWYDDCEYRIETKNGSLRWVYDVGHQVVDGDGKKWFYVNIVDIDQRKKLEEELKRTKETLETSERRYAAAVKGANLSVWEYDIQSNTVTMVSENLTSRIPTAVLSHVPDSCLPFVTERSRQDYLDFHAAIKSGEPNPSVTIWVGGDGGKKNECLFLQCSVSLDGEGKALKAYGIIRQVTLQQRSEDQYKQSMQDLLASNPKSLCTFLVNLTGNTCGEGHGIEASILASLQSQSASGLFNNILGVIPHMDDKRRFQEMFSCKNLIARFAAGVSSCFLDYRRKTGDGTIHWVRTSINMTQNPTSEDVEGVVYTLDINDEVEMKQLTQFITDEMYEYVAVLDIQECLFSFKYVSMRLQNDAWVTSGEMQGSLPYEAVLQKAVATWIGVENSKSVLEQVSVRHLVQELEAQGQYSLYIKGVSSKRACGFVYKHLQYGWLNDAKRKIVIAQTDATELFLEQQEKMKVLERESKRTKDILESISTGICELMMPDADHLIVNYANTTMFRLLGIVPVGNYAKDFESNPMISGYFKNAFNAVHPDDRKRVMDMYHDGYYKTHFSVPSYRIIGNEGKCYWVSEDVEYREDRREGKVFYATYRDVSEEYRLQDELEFQLEMEKKLRQEATKANQTKSQFLSNVSHDMRTPLNGIMGFTALALESTDINEIKDFLEKIRASGFFLTSLINDTLDISKIESGKYELHPMPIDDKVAVEAVLLSAKTNADTKGVRFVVDDTEAWHGYVLLDQLAVQKVLLNLLSNAVKFTPKGGTVTLKRIALNPPQNGYNCKIIVSDTGIGVSPDFLPKMFEPFTQEHPADAQHVTGTGLGLSIVKRLVTLMGGSISAESIQGKGTTFTWLCNFSHTVKPVQKLCVSCEKMSLAGKHVLMCEDNALNREIAQRILEKQGVTVTGAENGKEGVEKFLSAKPGTYDLILMDVMMPVMDGIATTKAIRESKNPQAMIIPIIAMTANAYDEDIKRCLDAGMNAHLSKPIDPEKLFETMNRFFS